MCSPTLFRSFTCLLLALPMAAHAQTYDLIRELNVAGGTVNAMALRGDTLFIGGDFQYVAQPRSYGTIVSAVDGSPDRVADRPETKVWATIADGQGGWFVGGDFTTYNNEPRNGLAHMGADGHLSDWNPQVDAATVGWALALDNGWVFTAGNELITAVDATTGANIGWNVTINGAVLALAVHDGILYVGGNFNTVGTETRSHFAAIDIATGTVTPWNVSSNGMVLCLLATPDALVAGGAFSTVAGSNRTGICALNYGTALCTTLNPATNAGGRVQALASQNGTLYFGGEFTSINDTPRGSLAAVDMGTGSLLDWDAPANAPVHALCVSDGLVMVGGAFSTLGGEQHPSIGAVDALSGAVAPWNTPSPDGVTYALAANGSGQLFIGGDFTTAGSVPRINLAALSMSTGEVLPWRHDATNGPVYTMAVGADKLFVGGDFGYIDGVGQQKAAAIDLLTDQLDPWYPVFNDRVNAMAVHGSRLYVGGYFTFVNGQVRHRVASLELPSLELTGWDPLLQGLFEAHAFGFHENLAYVGMSSGLAVVDTASSLIMPFTPYIEFGAVRCFAERNGTMYFGGSFVQVNGTTRNRAAAVNAATGTLTAWEPNPPTGSNEVQALAMNSATVFVGGMLYDVDGDADWGIVPVDPITGAHQITEDVFAQWDVRALLVANNTIYSGSSNYTVFHNARRGLAGYGISDLPTALNDAPSVHADANSALLWPDPYAGGALRMRWNSAYGGAPTRIELLDASGRMLAPLRSTATSTADGLSYSTLHGMEELDLCAGLYFVRLVFAERVELARLVVEK